MARQEEMPRPRGFEHGAGFLSPSYEFERRAILEAERRKQNAEAQARANAMLAEAAQQQQHARYAQIAQESSQGNQLALADMSNRGQMERQLAGSASARELQGDRLNSDYAMAGAQHGYAMEKGRQTGDIDMQKLAVDFQHRDALARLQADLQERQDSFKSGLTAKEKETDYLRARSDALNKTMHDFSKDARRLTPEGKARYDKFKKNLEALGNSPGDKGIDERLWLQQRSKLADEFYGSGLNSEVLPLGDMLGDYKDIGLMRFVRGKDGQLEPLGPKPDITDEEMSKYVKQLPGGGSLVMQPRAGMFSIVPPKAETAGSAANSMEALKIKDYSAKEDSRIKEYIAKQKARADVMKALTVMDKDGNQVIPTREQVDAAMGENTPAPSPQGGVMPQPGRGMLPGELPGNSPASLPQPKQQGGLSPEWVNAVGMRFPHLKSSTDNLSFLLSKYPNQESLLKHATEDEITAYFQSIEALKNVGAVPSKPTGNSSSGRTRRLGPRFVE